MLRVTAVFLALVAVLVWSGSPAAAQDNGNDNDDEYFTEFVDEVIEAANAFWRVQAPRLGISRYSPPNVRQVAYNERVRSECGNSRGVEHSYCTWENRVYLDYDSDDPSSLWSLWTDEQPFLIVTLIGHEWGHHIQNLLGVFENESITDIQTELQADCYMGVFARTYELSSDWVGEEDIHAAILDTADSGDYENTPRHKVTHGTPDERLNAFLKGYRSNDVVACAFQ